MSWDQIAFILGQIFGIVAVILGFISYQVRTRERLMLAQTATTIVFCLHYFLIGASPALVMNLVGVVRNVFYYHKEKPFFSWRGWPIVFAICSGTLGILAWENWYSVFVVAGLVINTVAMSFTDPQNIRKSILVTSPMVLIYDIFANSIGGAIYESVAIISSAIGLIRYYGGKKSEAVPPGNEDGGKEEN